MEAALIYCITQPLDKYDTMTMGVKVGIWKSYQDRPALFSLISLTTPILYQWEAGTMVEPLERIVRLQPDKEEGMVQMLESEIDGIRISQMLNVAKDPLEFFDRFRPEIVASAVRHPMYTSSQMDMVIKARVLSWAKFHGVGGWKKLDGLYKDEEFAVKENAYGR